MEAILEIGTLELFPDLQTSALRTKIMESNGQDLCHNILVYETTYLHERHPFWRLYLYSLFYSPMKDEEFAVPVEISTVDGDWYQELEAGVYSVTAFPPAGV